MMRLLQRHVYPAGRDTLLIFSETKRGNEKNRFTLAIKGIETTETVNLPFAAWELLVKAIQVLSGKQK